MLNFVLLVFLLNVILCEIDIKKPNFVIVMTDDQDIVLGSMNPMKNVQYFIENEGMKFTKSYSTSPICCPSRASFLTGLYVHNHLTVNNSLSGGCYGTTWRQKESNTFAAVLNNAGYNTFYSGKYLNQYGVKKAGGPEVIPPGWNEWHGLVGNSVYYNYSISHNGQSKYYEDVYLTDLIRDLSVEFIQNQTASQPFLMMIAPPAPHQPFTPASRHRGVYANVTASRPPNFNVTAKDKHWLLRMPPSPLPEEMGPELDRVFRSRWEALLAVDELVANVVEELDATGFLDNTYLIYTSDNGYHIGEFSQVYDKRQPYETDIKVPLFIRGPGIAKNITRAQPVLNIDLAPTIIQLAGLEVTQHFDGKPIDFNQKEIEERYMLVEYYGEGYDSSVDPECPWKYDGMNLAECYPEYDCKCQDSKNNTYACVRHIADWRDYKYCLFSENESFEEIYDLASDPYELENIKDQVFPSIKHWYKLVLARLLDCKGVKKCQRLIRENFDLWFQRYSTGRDDEILIY